MIKIIKNIVKILLLIVILFSTVIIKQPVMATTTPINSAYLYAKSSYGNMLRYNGVEVLTTFVVYSKDGVEYPAYCLDANMPGVGENGSYTVNTSNFLNDVMLWRVVTNGYPYKTVSELGCNTKEEAFTATKQAVYCMLYGREASWYTPIGEQGKRVVNAMAKILQSARNSTSVKPSSDINIQTQDNKWNIDSIDKNYVSQTFQVNTSSTSNKCKLSLSGNYPDGSKIVDSKNNTITTIASGTNFKVIMPIKSLTISGDFKINVQATLETKPVLYGKAPNSSWQDYAVTASIYEDASGSKTVNYKKNETKIIIQKQDLENKKPIPGVSFQILDSNKKIVYTDLVSDSNGRIEINNLVPGKYYLEELKTKEEYVKYDKQIECNITYNQTLTVTVNNTKATIIEQQTNNQQVIVEQNNSEIQVSNQNTSVNIQHNNQQVEISNSNNNKNEVNNNNTTDIDNKNENTNIQNNNNDVDINNENQNTNINNTNNNVDINNENQNTNINSTNNNVDINNENQNTNINSTNNNVDISNQNNNTNISNTNSNIGIQNTNTNSNIQNLNGIVKLPKTGM